MGLGGEAVDFGDGFKDCRDTLAASLRFSVGRPGIAQPVSFGPRVVRIEHVLMRAGYPRAAGDFGDNRRTVADHRCADYPALKFRANYRAGGDRFPNLHLT